MYNILICDDEQDIVNALKIYLANPDYHLLEAHTGQEALDALERKDIHLVLLDIMMPEMDGITALAKLRQVSNVPVILLTAKSEDTDKILGLNVGADDYITKPFNPVEVAARVRSQLRRYFQLGGGALRPEVLTLGTIQMDDREKDRRRGWGPGSSDAHGVRYSEAAAGAPGAGGSPPGRSTGRYGRTLPSAVRTQWRFTSATCGRRSRSTRRSPDT